MGLFATCLLCGKKKLSFSLDSDGLCSACRTIMAQQKETETVQQASKKQDSQKTSSEKFDVSSFVKQADFNYAPPLDTSKEYKSSEEKEAPVVSADAHHPLYGKKIVFARKLSIPRKEAVRMATAVGAIIRSEVSGKTDYLVLGEGVASSQEDKADDLFLEGNTRLQVICEREFINLLQGKDRFSVDTSDSTGSS